MEATRVLVVDDSRFMVSLISSLLESAGGFRVVGYALDGHDAVEKARALKPDVITMDVVMPRMGGLEATKIIAEETGIPIIVFSAYTKQGATLTLDALQAGAVDCIAKPSGELSMSLESVAEVLVNKIRGVAQQSRLATARGDSRDRARNRRGIPTATSVTASYATLPALSLPSLRTTRSPPTVVVIGASTGGIQALNTILPRFDGRVPFSVVVVQHFPAGFTAQLAERLDSICSMRVMEAQPGQRLARATAIIAPGGKNLEVTSSLRVRVTEDDSPGVMRPSIDVTFSSVARSLGPAAMAVVLTGMGKDGARGTVDIARAGGRVLVEDYRSATAYGMPRSVYETGSYEAILPLEQMATYILKSVGLQ